MRLLAKRKMAPMELPTPLATALSTFLENPDAPGAAPHLESAFWDTLREGLMDSLRTGGDGSAFLEAWRPMIDFGLIPQMRSDYNEVLQKFESNARAADSFLPIQTLSQFLTNALTQITHGDHLKVIKTEVMFNRLRLRRQQNQLSGLQHSRRRTIQEIVEHRPGATQCSAMVEKYHKSFVAFDELLLGSFETKKLIASGTFLSADEKRAHFDRETRIENEQKRAQAFIDSITDEELRAAFQYTLDQVKECLIAIVETHGIITLKEKELEKLEQQSKELSPLEIQSRMREEIDYLRDLMRLSAKRLHIQTPPFLGQEHCFLTPDELSVCIEPILEFDPYLLKNDRFSLFGKPSLLLIPGAGKALYDWKHNQIVVPIIPYQKDPLASLAAGVIEYKLDVDEDKKLIYSYNQLPEYKSVRSLIQLKSSLYRDYVIWMTQEYKGYRVLPQSVKKWFDQNIAPPRNDLFTPTRLQRFVLSTCEYRTMLQELEEKIKQPESATNPELWNASILQYQQGDFKRAIELLETLIKKDATFTDFAYYNLAQLYLKEMRKPDAVVAFEQFCSRHPQGWWTKLSREQIRTLQSC